MSQEVKIQGQGSTERLDTRSACHRQVRYKVMVSKRGHQQGQGITERSGTQAHGVTKVMLCQKVKITEGYSVKVKCHRKS